MGRRIDTYKSRAHQMRAFAREYRAGKISLPKVLRAAAMCGAVEERDRTLQILRELHPTADTAATSARIMQMSVLEVLGYK